MTYAHSWSTESLRFSLLGVPDGTRVSWQSLVGKEPESVTNRPSQQLSIEEGPFEGGRLVVTTQPGRVDISLTATPTDPMVHPSLGDFEQASRLFEQRINNMKLPSVSRLAMGATLHIPLNSAEESSKVIKELIPGFSIDEGVTDITLQMNRSKKLPKISGVVLNRLTKWSQLVTQTVHYQNHEQLASKQGYLIQLELDLNTHPNSKLPNASAFAPLITVFFNEARSLVQGDANG
ncbi:hypothetical protein [Pseudomonas zeae]|uniref:hypothetical protein n=1 Tax=Pseudomonas zeae TaxID=2745510 RepID=UPI003CFF7B9E